MTTLRIPNTVADFRFAPLTGVVAVALAAAWFVFSYGYIEDDAFIHLEYARSIAAGHGYAFNGHTSYGDTAPLWPLILAGIHGLGLDWIVAAKTACALGLLSTLFAVWRVGYELAREQPELQFFPVIAVLVTLVNPYFAHWSFSGMESVTAVGLSLWAILTGVILPPTVRNGVISAALLGIGPLLRPELLLLIAIVGPVLLWRFWTARTVGLGWLAAFAALMGAPVLLWSGYAWTHFGALVPNTNLAKKGGPLSEVAPRLLSVYVLGFPITLVCAGLVLFGRLMRRDLPMGIKVLLVWPAVCVLFYLADHTNVQTRYALLSMPSLTIAVLWLLGRAGWRRALVGGAAAAVLVGLGLIFQIVVPHIENKEQLVNSIAQISAFIKEQIPPTEPVAVFAIGEVAFLSEHPLVDTGGITDPSVVPFMTDSAKTVAWAKSRGARYYVAGPSPGPEAVPVFASDSPFIGWTLQRSRYAGRQTTSIYRLP
jgi:hypothetical protein